ncbi:ABC transporter permease [Labedaea rhizosphaerae]|uniref:Transport permease protein n=1 Tax=Labedaea rhizosphaerae TaxID=598644 RepID=A0A4R6S4F4_LABRH|nr:ABC transporter permease [Labedaea rhizosphaerae]TDP93967.1 ABC-2 type transport system permease protein [Labedaea rhizosphaerae]
MTGYLTLEIKRMLRTPRFVLFAIALPTLLYLLQSGLYKDESVPGTDVKYKAYLLCGLAAYGAFVSALSTGIRIAAERSGGWQAQLRLTPLSPKAYLLSKVVVSMIVALPAPIIVAMAGGFIENVHLSAGAWVQLTLGTWLASLPFAVLGVLLGLLASADSVQIYTAGVQLGFGFLSGLLIPLTGFPSWVASAVKAIPSYWLADIGHGALLGNNNTALAVLVLGAWTVALSALVVFSYRREAALA